jgi:hypothetical protein
VLEPGVRIYMESRFGVDFGHVRVHTSTRAAILAQAAHAEAFTVGQHLYFGAHYYDPHSARGRHLLAHELVHTLQQGAGSVRGVRPASHDARIGTSNAMHADSDADTLVQRAMADSFVPPELPSGELAHAKLLQTIGQEEGNEDLFSEVKIPGSTARNPAETAGRADFYQISGLNKTTIGVIMVGGEPQYLEAHYDNKTGVASMTTKAGRKYKHKELSAPRARTPKEVGCDKGPFTVCRLDKAPEKILFGDLKPPPSLERFGEGTIQIANYQTGIRNSARDLNTYVKAHPILVSPNKRTWNPETDVIRDIAIPEKLKLAGAKDKLPLRLYDKRKKDDAIKGLYGPLVVYKGKESGIWHYEWIPNEIPTEVRAAAKGPKLVAALKRIDDLVEELKTPPPKIDGGKKTLAHSAQPRANPRTGLSEPDLIQRTAKPFDPKTWPRTSKSIRVCGAIPLSAMRPLPGTGIRYGCRPDQRRRKSIRTCGEASASSTRRAAPL